MAFVAVFATGFLIALAAAPLTARLGRRLHATDRPGGRRKHMGEISRLGGIAMFVAFVAAVGVAQVFPGVPRSDPKEGIRLTGLLLGSLIMFAMGLLDDRVEMPAWPQFAAQTLAAIVAISFQIIVEYINSPISSNPLDTIRWSTLMPGALATAFTVAVTLFWLMGMMNTVNWLDGVDGLAAGVTAIGALMMFANAAFRVEPPQTSVSLLPLALAGACLGFLPYNFSPARVFMGSSGALFLGFALGALSIIGGAKVATVLLVMGAPILDVAWQIVHRLRTGRSPVQGDRGHLHFRLVDLGIPPRIIVLGYYVFAAAFGVLTLLLPSAIYKLVALAGLGVAVIVVMYVVSRAGERNSAKTRNSGELGGTRGNS